MKSVQSIVMLAGVAGLCVGASAREFAVRSADTASLGSPITTSWPLFQSNAGGEFGPSEFVIEGNQNNQNPQYDSYTAIDTGPSHPGVIGVKNDGFQANPGDLSNTGSAFSLGNANQISGLWFMAPTGPRTEVPAASNALFGGLEAVFLGRYTFRSTTGAFPDGTLSLGANGMVVDIRDFGTENVGSPSTDSLLVTFTAFATGVFGGGPFVTLGLDGGNLEIQPTGNIYELRDVVTTAVNPNGTARWQIHDLYVVNVVPSPAVFLPLGMFMAMRTTRRRAD